MTVEQTRNESAAQELHQIEEEDNTERLTMTQADVYDSIKPSMGVAEQRA